MPVEDANGEIVGLFLGIARYVAAQFEVDRYMAFDLDPLTPPVLIADTTTQTNTLAVAGGRMFFTDWDPYNQPAPTWLGASDTFWFTGGRAAVGSVMSVRMFAPPTGQSIVRQSLCVASSAFLPAGVTYPPLQGLLGLDLTNAWVSILVSHDSVSGEAQLAIPVPNVPALNGVRLAAQSVTWDVRAGAALLGNTAWLSVD